MSEENLGRVQGAGFFFSTAASSTSADMATLSPSTIKPVYGDNIIFANGDIRNITAVSDTAVTCGGVVANLQGPDGVRIVSSVLQGQDAAGGNIYLQTFSDNTTATFTAPRGLEGLGILYSSANADAQTTLFAKDSLIIPAGREVKIGDIIFCNAHLFSVNAVSETSFSVIHLAYFSTDSAQKDGAGNVITTTYAKTSDLTEGTITVKFAEVADSAAYAAGAGSAINDGDGNEITGTYATKTQLTNGSVTKVGTSTVGSATKPVYLNEGVPTEGTYTLGAACAKSVSDSSSASALSSTDTNVPTVRDIYYGLPSINGNHTYNSSKTIYAPESSGTAGYYLKSNGSTTAPSWIDPGRRSWFGTCETGASTAEKIVTCNGFVLEAGAKISVYFKYNNTAGIPTLNVNGTGAFEIRASYQLQDTQSMRWYPGQIVEFVYYGNDWILQQPVVATTDYYGVSKVASLSLNGSPNATPSFYAPTSAGTKGQFIRWSSNGYPSWSAIGIGRTISSALTGQTVAEVTGDGYIRMRFDTTYDLLICFGAFTSTNSTITFPQAFSQVPFVITSPNPDGDTQTQRVAVKSVTKTGFTTQNRGSYSGRYIAIGFIAIAAG